MLTNCKIRVGEPPIENLPNQISGTWHGLPGRKCGQCLQHDGLFAGKNRSLNLIQKKSAESRRKHIYPHQISKIKNFIEFQEKLRSKIHHPT